MTSYWLIEVITKLREKGLTISKQKAQVLSNLENGQAEVLKKLLDEDFINQSNINYAIGEISKTKYWMFIEDVDFERLRCATLEDKELNNKVLKLMFTWSKAITTYRISNMFCNLNDILIYDQLFFTRPGVMEVLLNKKICDEYIVDDIVFWYEEYVSELYDLLSNTTYEEILSSVNNYILDEDILKVGIEEIKDSGDNYSTILGIDNHKFLTVNIIENLHNMISGLIKNNKLNVSITTLTSSMNYCDYEFTEVENIQDLYSILMQVDYTENTFNYIMNLFIRYYDYSDYNISNLLSDIYENQTEIEDANRIFNEVVRGLVKRNNKVGDYKFSSVEPIIKDIPDFSNLVYSIYKQYVLNYISDAICNHDGKDILEYSKLLMMIKNSTQKYLYDVLNKIDNIESKQNKLKVVSIFNKVKVFDCIENISGLPEIIIDAVEKGISEKGIQLLKNPKFLSSYYISKFVSLVVNVNKKCEDENFCEDAFYLAFSTFNFNDPRLYDYADDLLCYDKDSLMEIYQTRTKNKDAFIENVPDCIYDALISKDDSNYEKLVNILNHQFDNYIDSDTKIVYQKKIEKK